jgi:hypothetical protein
MHCLFERNTMELPRELASLYVELWNEPDAAQRRAIIERLWLPEGRHFVGERQVIGFDALEERVRGSHEKNVRDRRFLFRVAGPSQVLHDSVMFHWMMVDPAAGNRVEAVGLQVLLLREGRIHTDYQFILPMTSDVMARVQLAA